ncbi:MAG TPA: hypothetical protein VHC22_08620 [Pirellulales bacterium]|nr:hypothetical protein [Pirellulales bacterium]
MLVPFWGLAATAAPSPVAGAAEPRELLDEAVQEYRSALDCTDHEKRLAMFRRAELLFARLADGAAAAEGTADAGHSVRAIRNADLYVNLGNAALGAERLGPAILAYRRALLLDPDHHRAQQNLAHARTLLAEWVPRPEEAGWFDTFFAWGRRLSPDEVRMSAAAVFLITAALLAASIRWRQPGLRTLALLPGCTWLLLMGLILFGAGANSLEPAVVIVPEVIARSADSAGAPPRLPQPLPGGTELDVMETRADWARVRLFDGRDAWLPTSALELVGQMPSNS